MSTMAPQALMPACFVLFHRICSNICAAIETIDGENVFCLDLQMAVKKEHSNDKKKCPKWRSVDPEQFITNIREYFETLQSTNRVLCTYVMCKDIVPILDKNNWNIFHDPQTD